MCRKEVPVYQIERKDGKVIIRRGDKTIFSEPLDSWVVWNDGQSKASRISDLKDDQLLIALSKTVDIKADV